MSADAPAPVRPSLPGLAWLAVGMWAGVACVEPVAWDRYVGGSAALVGIGTLMLAATAIAFTWRSAGVVLVVAGVLAGAAAGSLQFGQWARDIAVCEEVDGAWTGECLNDPVTGPFGARSDVRVELSGRRLKLSVRWPRGMKPPEAGRRVRIRGSYGPPGRDEWGRRALRVLSAGTLRVSRFDDLGWARSLRGLVGPVRARAITAIGAVPGPGGDLLGGVVAGDRRRLSGTQTESDFRTTGLTHLVAVSGSHLVVVAVLLGAALGALGIPRALRAALTVAVLGAYVVATGVQPSAVRAWLMAVCVSGSGVLGRRADSAAAVAFAAVAAMASSPAVIFDLGFQLSVAAVAGLVVFARLTQAWATAALPRWGGWLAAPLALTLTAQAVTLPLTTTAFGTLSLIAPVANLVAGPLISAALVLGLGGLMVSVVSTAAGRMLLMAGGAVGNLTADLAGWLGAVPGAAVELDSHVGAITAFGALIAAATWVGWPRPQPRLARIVAGLGMLAVLASSVGPPAPPGPSMVFLDVGQGDAVLVRDGAKVGLVDAGPSPADLRAALARHGVRRLEWLLITHLHDDHFGGAAALQGPIRVGSVIVAKGAQAQLPDSVQALDADVIEVAAPDRLDVGSVQVSVLSPRASVADPDENHSSVVVLVQSRGRRAMLTGDAESDVLSEIGSAGAICDVDLLKVGHHGSRDAVSDINLRVLAPELAVISVGTANRYGHPAPSTLSLLARSGVEVLRTDVVGDITAVPGEEGWRLKLQKRGHAAVSCATLVAARFRPSTPDAHEHTTHRSQARVPDRERAGVLARSGTHPAQEARWRGG